MSVRPKNRCWRSNDPRKSPSYNFRFLGAQISDTLAWSFNTKCILKKKKKGTAQHRLYFLRRLKSFGMSSNALVNLYRSTIESVLLSVYRLYHSMVWQPDCSGLQTATKDCDSSQKSLTQNNTLARKGKRKTSLRTPASLLMSSSRSFYLKKVPGESNPTLAFQ